MCQLAQQHEQRPRTGNTEVTGRFYLIGVLVVRRTVVGEKTGQEFEQSWMSGREFGLLFIRQWGLAKKNVSLLASL